LFKVKLIPTTMVRQWTVLDQKFWLSSANTKPMRRDTSTSTPHNYAATSSIWSAIKPKCAQRTQHDTCTTTYNHCKSSSWCDGAQAGRGVQEVSQLHLHHHLTGKNSQHNGRSTLLWVALYTIMSPEKDHLPEDMYCFQDRVLTAR
jgi:hypothetical protein